VGNVFKTMAICAETLIFLMVGMNMLFFDISHNFDTAFFFFTLFLCLLFRATNVFSLTWLSNLLRPPEKHIDLGSQVVMWNAGLRGAIAYALAAGFPDDNKHQKTVINTTMWIIIATIFLHGGATVPLLKFFKLRAEDQKALPSTEEDAPSTPYGADHDHAAFKESREDDDRRPSAEVDETPAGTPYDREAQKERVRELFGSVVYYDDTYIRPFLCKPKTKPLQGEVSAATRIATAEASASSLTGIQLDIPQGSSPNSLASGGVKLSSTRLETIDIDSGDLATRISPAATARVQ